MLSIGYEQQRPLKILKGFKYSRSTIIDILISLIHYFMIYTFIFIFLFYQFWVLQLLYSRY
jgi:hypothetical protein